jgi:autophagy-related protein 13
MGSLLLSTRYLTSPNFQLDELECLLSSRFLSLDEGPEFTPTLAKNQKRDYLLSGSPGLPSRPRSPLPSVAEKSMFPAALSRTTSLPDSLRSTRSIASAIRRVPSVGPSTSSVAASSHQDGSGARSREEGRLLSGIAERKESTGAGRGTVSGIISLTL